ncbi:MAG: methyl-accepting chemotaxis protein [Pseudobdellovibrio sp.]
MLNRLGLSKLLLGFNLFILIFGLASGGIYLLTSNKSMSQLITTSEIGINQLALKSVLIKSIAAIQSNIVALQAETDKDSRDIRVEVVSGFIGDADKTFTTCGNECKEIYDMFATYKALWIEVHAKIDANDMPGAIQLTNAKLAPAAENLIDKLDSELSNTKKKTQAEFTESVNSSKKAQTILIGIIVISNILMFTLGFIFKSAIIKNFKVLTERLNKTTVNTFSMSNNLSDTADKINGSTDKQTSAIQEIVSALDEINSMASKNSETAESALNCSDETTRVVQDGQSAVEDMINIMGEINEVNKGMENFVVSNNNQLETIVSVINSINEKTKVINDIVFQTKLLSFNASVEAARAGEHGKGFAVVAEEVGSLAQMSGNAAREISDLVQSSLNQVKDIVQSSKSNVTVIVNENTEKINLGNQRAHACGEVLNNISSNVSTLNELIRSVATATQEQQQGVSEIGEGMRRVDAETQLNKQATEKLTNNSIELNNEADNLKAISFDIAKTISGAEIAEKVMATYGELKSDSSSSHQPTEKSGFSDAA